MTQSAPCFSALPGGHFRGFGVGTIRRGVVVGLFPRVVMLNMLICSTPPPEGRRHVRMLSGSTCCHAQHPTAGTDEAGRGVGFRRPGAARGPTQVPCKPGCRKARGMEGRHGPAVAPSHLDLRWPSPRARPASSITVTPSITHRDGATRPSISSFVMSYINSQTVETHQSPDGLRIRIESNSIVTWPVVLPKGRQAR